MKECNDATTVLDLEDSSFTEATLLVLVYVQIEYVAALLYAYYY
jgi:hypothetical protein